MQEILYVKVKGQNEVPVESYLKTLGKEMGKFMFILFITYIVDILISKKVGNNFSYDSLPFFGALFPSLMYKKVEKVQLFFFVFV